MVPKGSQGPIFLARDVLGLIFEDPSPISNKKAPFYDLDGLKVLFL